MEQPLAIDYYYYFISIIIKHGIEYIIHLTLDIWTD